MTSINRDQISELEKHYRTNLINSLIGFKPFNLLGTISESGANNLCVVSSAFHMGSNPALFGMIIRPERDNNDSLRNIKTIGQYTLNNVLPEWYMEAHQTSASYPSGVSEFEECNLTEMYEDDFKAPFVKESNIRMGLKLQEIIDIKFNGTTLVIGEVAHILIEDQLIGTDGFIDHLKANTVTVAGLDSYYIATAIGRLTYAKPGIFPRLLPPE